MKSVLTLANPNLLHLDLDTKLHCDPPNGTLGHTGLGIVPHYKYLGTFVDTHLTFTKQAAETCKSVSFKSYCLSKIKKYLDTDSMIKLYKAYIQPYFDYNNIFNSTSTSYYQHKLIKLQQRCLRNCLPTTKKYEKQELHILTGVNSLKDRAESHLLRIMYKCSRSPDYPKIWSATNQSLRWSRSRCSFSKSWIVKKKSTL